jgi:hypothetical protein
MSDETGYLFDMAQEAANEQQLERSFAAAGIVLGTSAFTAAGYLPWSDSEGHG